jgi:choline dehydrogenase-like flavoprotein
MATKYGIPEGSSLADWPFSYETLEPFYERAEWELGVAGADNENSQRSHRKRNYPLPPVPPGLQTIALTDGALRLGWETSPVPLLINTEPYQGRGACIECKYCVGFACPSDAKSGSHNTVIPRALATGNCDLVTGAIAERIEVDQRGNVSGVSYLADSPQGTNRETARSKFVIVSAGAISQHAFS